MATLSPFVYWGQNKQFVFLKVEIKDTVSSDVVLGDEKLVFKANGTGVGGRNDYAFEVEFYLPIDDKKSKYRMTERFVEFQMEKVAIGQIWPRLTVEQKKPFWLKVDFDKVALEDDSDDSEDEAENSLSMEEEAKAFTKKLEEEMGKSSESMFSGVAAMWLFLYNMFQWVGYSYIFLALCLRYRSKGEMSKLEAVEAVGPQLMICQVAAVLEILHPLIGLVKTGVSSPLIQVLGRNFILFMVIFPESKLHDEPLVWWLFLAWAGIEIVRYPFYMLSSINRSSKTITWLRYTMWIPLYPLGFALESLIIVKTIPMYEISGRWTVELPNYYNMSFHFPMFLRLYLILFLIGSCMLLKRMYSQRKRRLQSGSSASKQKKS